MRHEKRRSLSSSDAGATDLDARCISPNNLQYPHRYHSLSLEVPMGTRASPRTATCWVAPEAIRDPSRPPPTLRLMLTSKDTKAYTKPNVRPSSSPEDVNSTSHAQYRATIRYTPNVFARPGK